MADNKKILIVDDEKPISDINKFNLTKEGFEVFTAFDGEEALEQFKEVDPDLILLDIMLPKMDGMEVAKEIRRTSEVPIIMVSAKDSEVDKVIGLELGADDYVTKPFSNRELLARVKANLRRSSLTESASGHGDKREMIVGELRIVPQNFAIYRGNEQIELTHREFELVYYLAQHMGEVISRENLLETVWDYDYFGDVRTVDVTVRRLREKIEKQPSRPEYVCTRRGVGYYMAEPHDED